MSSYSNFVYNTALLGISGDVFFYPTVLQIARLTHFEAQHCDEYQEPPEDIVQFHEFRAKEIEDPCVFVKF